MKKEIVIAGATALVGVALFFSLATPRPQVGVAAKPTPEFHKATNRYILDAKDATERHEQFRTLTTEIEAERLFQLAKRETSFDEWGTLSHYNFAATMFVRYGGKAQEQIAHVCHAELEGHDYLGSLPGDCERLWNEESERMDKETKRLLGKGGKQ